MSRDGAPTLTLTAQGTATASGTWPVSRAGSGTFHELASTDGVMVLGSTKPGRAPLLMAGEVTSRMAMLDVVNMIATSGWSGELRVIEPEGQRSLYCDQGVLKKASSDIETDRLGEIIYQLGAISRADLDDALARCPTDMRLGEHLIERGLIPPERVFYFVQKQVEHIFHACILTPSGFYTFTQRAVDESSADVNVHIPMQGLLMEGVQRIDEMELFKQRIPRGDLCPEIVASPGRASMEPNTMTTWMYIDGERTVDEMARQTGLGEFETHKCLYALIKQGYVAVREPKRINREALAQLVLSFNQVLQDLFIVIATYHGLAQTRAAIAVWIEGAGYDPFFGHMSEDGSLDASTLEVALLASGHERPLEALYQALQELSNFALFSAQRVLPRSHESHAIREFTGRLSKIRI